MVQCVQLKLFAMDKRNQTARLHELNRRIRAGQYPNAESLAQEWEVTPRVIYKDRQRLEKMGADIVFDKAHGGWALRNPNWILPATHLSDSELMAFFLAVEIARAQGNAGMEEPLQSAALKIEGALNNAVSVDVAALRDETSYAFAPAAPVRSETYLQLARAAAARQKVSVRYYTASRGKWSQRTLHPYQLRLARGEWILIAFDENRGELRCFNIARIETLHVLNHYFERQRDFDGEQYVREMFVTERGDEVFEVAIRFDEYQSRYIRERTWHPQQKPLEPQADGGVILKFPASGLNEIARWVMGYGSHAQVLQPPKLRQIVRNHIREMAKLYEQE